MDIVSGNYVVFSHPDPGDPSTLASHKERTRKIRGVHTVELNNINSLYNFMCVYACRPSFFSGTFVCLGENDPSERPCSNTSFRAIVIKRMRKHKD